MTKFRLTTTRRTRWARRWVAGAALCAAACSPEQLIDNAPLPDDVPDPGVTKTAAGAVAAYRGTVGKFAQAVGGAFHSAIPASALLADELQPFDADVASRTAMQVDSRVLPEVATIAEEVSGDYYRGPYGGLQSVRGQTHEARGLLLRYAPDSTALIGHVYAIEGYALVYLADLFCSGIPLSTLDYDGDFTLAAGSASEEVYRRAVALFDSTLALTGAGQHVLDLARVGKGRALLALGDFTGAAQAVAAVPDDFRHALVYDAGRSDLRNFASTSIQWWQFSVSDRAGGNGLDYRSSLDPRTSATPFFAAYHPDKYSQTGDTPIVIASGVEARLVEAEAALRAGDAASWLATLNHLRATAISPALADTTDPGTPDARVDLQFRERAFWLFLTGHRLGDLRRLMRQYGRSQGEVFPVGPYPGGRGTYGTDVTMPIPAAERAYNPRFTGCIHRDA